MSVKKGLGKGLGALLSVYEDEPTPVKKETIKEETIKVVEKNGVQEISIKEIYPNPNQPRKNFDETALNELASSIKIHGVIQPIIVNKNEGEGYMIIAGERRWRASKIAGLDTVPCVVKDYTNKQIKEISIIENLQREDLNPIEAARAIRQLMDEYGFTQEGVAERIGISRPNIANTLRLLSLTSDVIKLVEDGKLSAGHARCLVPVTDASLQLKLASMAIGDKISVREFEKLIKNTLKPKENKVAPEQSIELKEMVNEMQRVFSTKVSVIGNDRKGRIYIDYYSRDDLDRICEILELVKEKKLTLKDLSNFNKRQK